VIFQTSRNHVQHIAFPLHLTPHSHEHRLQQDAPLPLGDTLPDDEIHVAGLVFQGHEDDATGATRPLPRDHQAGCMNQAPVSPVPYLRRAQDPLPA
jgi:hypothetical protein